MKDFTDISNVVIRRLPRYRRALKSLIEKGVQGISSAALSDLISLTASQIRQDLNNFGSFGLHGYGYNVSKLYHQINLILGLNKRYKIIIIGTENIGSAIANYISYKPGLDVIAYFNFSLKRKKVINNIEVYNIKEIDKFLYNNEVDIGIITTGIDRAQSVADRLIKGKVKGIWNFTEADLVVPDSIVIENVNLSDSLCFLTYQICQRLI